MLAAVAQAATSATSAASSAQAASTSETNAAQSETNAAQSAADALQSKTDAEAAAQSASASATAAAASETAASASAAEAAASAIAAQEAQTNAEASATNADANATAAETAAQNAIEAASHYPEIDETSKNWNVWDVDAGEFVDTGVKAEATLSVDGIEPDSAGNVQLSAVQYVPQTLTAAQAFQAQSNVGLTLRNGTEEYALSFGQDSGYFALTLTQIA